MNKKFLEWARKRKNYLLQVGISSEIPDFEQAIEDKKLTNPCQTVYYDSEARIGSVSVWQSGCMDIEIIDCVTEEIEYYRHFDKIKSSIAFDNILEEFFEKMN